ncbi:hypothetical protein ACIPYU_09480 [Paenarthrobacter nicotinovorans]|uniref:hypothetical protein n=1 Tax=Paenarthrobacter nicotinovorans TaxID=29320 RepID=UPI0037F97669
MVNAASQGDFAVIGQVLDDLESSYPGTDLWNESPFRWVLAQPSATKGAIGRRLIQAWAYERGLRLRQTRVNNQYYLELNSYLIQVKFSTLWDGGYYRFQQIRDHEYDYCLCLGLAPMDANAWLIPKYVLDTHVIGTRGQHTGAGSGETWWFEATPGYEPLWLAECGGQLIDVGEGLVDLGR